MGIRASNNKKNHHRQQGVATALALVADTTPTATNDDLLRFETSHPEKPCFVDLTIFKEGEQQRRQRGGHWSGPFTGRPQLIAEMAPALRDHLSHLAKKSVKQYIYSLRTWWRLFDAVETSEFAHPLQSTTQLNDLHRQYALDKGMRGAEFLNFLQLANTTRAALGVKPLYWQRLEDKPVNRHLPPTWQTDLIRRTFKHRWFATLDRWSLADEMRLLKKLPEQDAAFASDPERDRLLRNYLRFDAAVNATGKLRPAYEVLRGDLTQKAFYKAGYSIRDMRRGLYPDGEDIRAAFHLCMATTGWNAAVLLSLDVSKPFIESHPKDPSRYILRGYKARAGGTEQVTEGLFKTQGGAGAVIQLLIARTAPLRDQLACELRECKAQLARLTPQSTQFAAVRRRTLSLEHGIRSPWLFAAQGRVDIRWLTDDDYFRSVEKITSSYIGDLIANLNRHQPDDRQLSRLTASDLRDAYAANAYHASGGSILHVMRALGHRGPRSTQIYLHNTLLKEEHRRIFGTFSAALWQEMKAQNRVDPTILAKLSRDGEATTEQRERLESYRTILLSRIGVGCKDPFNPPRHIAPDFVPDGKSMCHVQRCTLCVDHAIVFPESLSGLCKRMAELHYLRSQMGVSAFQESSFLDEMENTGIALQAFDATDVQRNIGHWTSRIASGLHRVIEFDGHGQRTI